MCPRSNAHRLSPPPIFDERSNALSERIWSVRDDGRLLGLDHEPLAACRHHHGGHSRCHRLEHCIADSVGLGCSDAARPAWRHIAGSNRRPCSRAETNIGPIARGRAARSNRRARAAFRGPHARTAAGCFCAWRTPRSPQQSARCRWPRGTSLRRARLLFGSFIGGLRYFLSAGDDRYVNNP